MATIRVDHRKKFTTVDRRSINDARLSFRARGLLIWLLDKPHDWRVDSKQIAQATTEGRDAIRAAMRELIEHGYMTRERLHAERGRFVTETVVREVPTRAWKSGVGGPGVGEPGANTKTVTEDCYPQTPRRRAACFVCGVPCDAPCGIVEADLGDADACPWIDDYAEEAS